MSLKLKAVLVGAAAGTVNGFFGAGGGMVLVPLLLHFMKLEPKSAFASSVAIILPLSLVSAIIYILRGNLDFITALPYLLGGLIGGLIGGTIFKKVPAVWLKRGLGLLIIYGGVRCLI